MALDLIVIFFRRGIPKQNNVEFIPLIFLDISGWSKAYVINIKFKILLIIYSHLHDRVSQSKESF